MTCERLFAVAANGQATGKQSFNFPRAPLIAH